ncbi:MAG: OmpA family protein [Sulfurimonas sp.]|jgi:OOP family OmpA-OmpF porin
MKKSIVLSAVLLGTLAMASTHDFEISPVAGYNFSEGNTNIENHAVYGAEVQYNGFNTMIKPELSVLQSNAASEKIVPSIINNEIYRTALNGVYEYNKIGMFIPSTKAGLGYETMSKHYSENKDGIFFDAGASTKVSLTEAVALKLEAVYMAKPNHTRWDSDTAVLAGVTIALGAQEKAKPVAATPAPVVVKAPAPAPVVKKVVEVKAEKVNLHINFETDSAKIAKESIPRVEKFSTFLKKSPEYKAEIIGHTDSTGSDAHNDVLSANRATAVKDMIIKNGVAADRVRAVGKGEKEPVASNKTKDGRAANRRIEAQLIETK